MSAPQDLLQLIHIMEPALWGGVISVGLFGAMMVQAFIYANNNKDGWILRSLVVFVISVDFANIILAWSALRFEFVENYGNPLAITTIPSYAGYQGLLLGLTAFGVQLFFASRVYLLNKKNVIAPAIIVITAIGGLVGAIMITVDCARLGMMVAFNKSQRVKLEAGSFSVLNSISDLVSTFFLTRYLWGAEGATSTKAVVAKLLRNAVTRGFVVTIFQITNVIVFATQSDTLNWVVLWWNLGKIYIMTMLAILNARSSLHASLQGSTTLHLSSLNHQSSHQVRENNVSEVDFRGPIEKPYQRSENYALSPRIHVQKETYAV